MILSEAIINAMKSQVRSVEGRVYVFNADDSTAYTFRNNDYLQGFTIERIGAENKFFGFGITTKTNIKVRDRDRKLNLNTSQRIRPFHVDRSSGSGVSRFVYPHFNITEVHRDENTNELSITGYDPLYKAADHTLSELELIAPYTIQDVVAKIATFLGLASFISVNVADSSFATSYPEGANFEGTETLREVLDAAAAATQTIYYVDRNNKLTFKRLDISGEAVLDITKEDYFTLDSKTNRRLATIIHATELGDNLTVSTTETGSTQIIRDNPFWELREDITTLLDNALIAAGGLTINQFDCEWRGNYLLEIGDKIALTTKDDGVVYSYVLNDTITYDGTLKERSSWSYESDKEETPANPTNLGEALKQTFARVDKANKQIDIVVSETQSNSEAIAAIGLNTQSISASVSQMREDTDSQIDALGKEVATLTDKVSATMTPENVQILIENEMANGLDEITTATGYTFDEEGLTISKTDSEMKTQITEDGMTVAKNDETVLIADNQGVKAANLHATTYLIIGNNSRFEDYTNLSGESRTGCFWIGR